MRFNLVQKIVGIAFTIATLSCINPGFHLNSNGEIQARQHGNIFNASSEADARLEQSFAEIEGRFNGIQLTGNADLDLARMLNTEQKTLMSITDIAYNSIHDTVTKIIAGRMMDFGMENVSLDGINMKLKNYTPSNTNHGLGKEIHDLLQGYKSNGPLPASFDHKFIVLILRHYANIEKMNELIRQYADSDTLKRASDELVRRQQPDVGHLRVLLARHRQ